MWNHDRQAHETREKVEDRVAGEKYYTEQWRNPETGEVTYAKTGDLSDPNMHGPASHR